jgi:hypothetical protein
MSVVKFKMFGRKLAFEEHPYQAMLPGDTVSVYNSQKKRWDTIIAKKENENISVGLVEKLTPDLATQFICEALDRLEHGYEVCVCYSYHQESRRAPENPELINLAVWINPLKKSQPIDFPWCPNVMIRRDGVPVYELFKRTRSFK